MKYSQKKITLIWFLLVISYAGFSQKINSVFDRNAPVTWLGLDFTKAKFLGDREKFGSTSDVKFLLKSWNDLIEREKDKYNVARATQKTKVEYQSSITVAHNEELDISEMLSSKPDKIYQLKAEDISTIINGYEFQGLSGIGLMFNIEAFNKFEGQATIWITFIDLETKEILLTDRMIATPGGAGLRNYWARSILVAMEKMEKQMSVWKKKYVR